MPHLAIKVVDSDFFGVAMPIFAVSSVQPSKSDNLLSQCGMVEKVAYLR